jgi:pimeloyl-[acyl-carrier protein] synthase
MDVAPRSTVFEGSDKGLSLLQLMNQDVLADPHSLYRALRERDPVYWDPYMHSWKRNSRGALMWVSAA